jgi:phage-related protein
MKVHFYTTAHERSPVEDFIEDLPEGAQKEIIEALNLLAIGASLAMPLSRNLSSVWPGLHELRFRGRAGQVRLFYYVRTGDAVYILHAIRKKTQELPRRDIALIIRRMKEI